MIDHRKVQLRPEVYAQVVAARLAGQISEVELSKFKPREKPKLRKCQECEVLTNHIEFILLPLDEHTEPENGELGKDSVWFLMCPGCAKILRSTYA